jgi:hypothetical protein
MNFNILFITAYVQFECGTRPNHVIVLYFFSLNLSIKHTLNYFLHQLSAAMVKKGRTQYRSLQKEGLLFHLHMPYTERAPKFGRKASSS